MDQLVAVWRSLSLFGCLAEPRPICSGMPVFEPCATVAIALLGRTISH